jgi:hypothetical protein
MNHPACLVGLFAAHGFLLDQNAVSYLRVHDYQEVLNLFTELNPEILVIDLPAIRKIHRADRSNVVIIRVREFRPRLKMKKKPDMISECLQTINTPKNGEKK